MGDLISRQDAIRLAEQGQIQGFEWQFKKLCELPSEESERKTGKWIWYNKMPFERCRCSECGYYRQLKCPEPDNYCPNCGSDMRGEKHVND